MPMKENEVRKNTAQGAIAATIKPPIVGPITRPMLPPRATRVRAAGSSDSWNQSAQCRNNRSPNHSHTCS